MKKNPISLLKSVIARKSESQNVERLRKYILGCSLPEMKSLDLLQLTKQELEEIEAVWGQIGVKPFPWFYQLYKTVDTFNPQYLSDDLYFPIIVRALNPNRYVYAFSHKGHFPVLFGDIIQPKLIVVCNRGVFYNSEFDVIGKDEMMRLIKSRERFIIKPTTNTSCGKGVKVVSKGCDEAFYSLIDEYGSNWIAQDVLEQSEETAQFNSSSLNSFRVTTLFINGKVTTQSIVLKMGGEGSVVDNLAAGGLFVGVTQSGELREFGMNKKFGKCEQSASGVKFKGIKIDEVPAIANRMEYYHRRYFPSLGIVGWDVALDKYKQPVVIEANLVNPGILVEQLAISTPIFGERTEEVIHYVLKKTK